ncbi:peptidase [Rudanella paleaurantiibacter]|uniref:Peptidase n=1 Tax=Rudanella paleaurantiibacter TaxID=2614655 RepID=A0A7J5TUP3_9BACT|nr:M14 metallopeptidase family protein [Rudanella paleaurantiibacter]KAB7727882.1 peptidase [Rudanella paleaurantiibacter]
MFQKLLRLCAGSLLSLSIAVAQPIPSPKEHFGFNIGDDYQLANYTQTEAYFKKLAQSDRVKLVDIGLTEEGRHQYMLVVSSPENLKNLARYQDISRRLARAEGLTDEQARALAAEGKAVVWIDGGLHSTETVGTMQLIETAWQLVSRKDPETTRILNDCIVLLVHANPDGHELVANWYMRNPVPQKRSLEYLPRLYEKYAGHDNNRDFYIMNLKETQNMGRQLFVDWIPQIMYNHHQRGPAGSVLAGPPYRDPFNYVFDPLMITGLDAIGASMINRLNSENKPGYTRLNGSVFSTWYNGGLRTTTHFHNMLGLLTEIIGGPTPEDVPVVPQRLLPNGNTPLPVLPQKWHFKQSIDYSMSLNYSVLDYAARHRDQVLYNIYRMGKNSIERGSGDYWTLSPKRIDAIQQAYRAAVQKPRPDTAGHAAAAREGGIPKRYYDAVLKDSTLRDARGYVISANQPDFPTAVKFLNALIRTGIQVHRATAPFSVNGRSYPTGSYVVKTAQSFRPHILDMFEPQDHPNDFAYAGGPPIRPYDAAGWTLAFQMGVQFDRVLTDFNGPFEALPYGELLNAPAANVATTGAAAGYVLPARMNNAFVAVNDLLKAGVEVFRMPAGSGKADAGSFFVPASAKSREMLTKAGVDLGLSATGVSKRPAGKLVKLKPARVAIWDTYGGSMPSGWLRLLMEQFHFPASVVYSPEIDGGDLRKKYDVLVFVPRAIPAKGARGGETGGYTPREPKVDSIPAEFRSWVGRITPDKSIPALKKFLEEGGTIVTMGSSANLAYHLDLPVRNALTELGPTGQERPLPAEKYYIPGSLLRVSLDSTHQANWGMPAQTDVYFDSSPVFHVAPSAIASGAVQPLAWFATDKPLRSGWAWGQQYLQDGVAAFAAPVGAGRLVVVGPEATFRAQPHGTFKLLFNQLYRLE